jgi:four helix bundle protein
MSVVMLSFHPLSAFYLLFCPSPLTAFANRLQYPAHFLSKLTDADGELQETLHWLKTAKACEYVSAADHERLIPQLQQIGRLLGSMINRHESFYY